METVITIKKQANLLTKLWVIVNLTLLCAFFVLFILSFLWPEHVIKISSFSQVLIPILVVHLFYSLVYAGGFVAFVTFVILIWQIVESIKERKQLSVLLITSEILVILFGVIDAILINVERIGKLYYMIPGW